jgi:FkbM family methyltransferase
MVRFFHRGVDFLTDLTACGYQLSTFFDVGAHKGESIDWIMRSFPSANVHSFEPIPDHIGIIRGHLSTRHVGSEKSEGYTGNLILNEFAIGSECGYSEIVVQGPGTHLIKTDEKVDPSKLLVVPVQTIDNYCKDHDVSIIDLLKIDVEGHEMNVLKGAAGMLSRRAIRFIYLEVGMNRRNIHHTFFMDVVSFLNSFEYEIFGIYEQINEFLEDRPNLRRANIGFISRKLCDNIPGRNNC